MTALQWIVKEAKKIKKEYPKRFKTWREYVAQASAIYASKHKGKSPVGKKQAVKKKAAKKKAVKKVARKKVGNVTLKKANYHARDERYIIMNDGKPHLDAQPFFKEDAKRIATALRKVKAKRKKVGAVSKKATTTHKDTKSHNVNIKVMSGIGSKVMDEIKTAIKKVQDTEKYIDHHKLAIKNSKNKMYKAQLKKQIVILKKYMSEQKAHIRELKKHI